jgi:hypothetical protein
MGRIPAIDHETTAGDPSGGVADQKGDGMGHVFGPAQSQGMHEFNGAAMLRQQLILLSQADEVPDRLTLPQFFHVQGDAKSFID